MVLGAVNLLLYSHGFCQRVCGYMLVCTLPVLLFAIAFHMNNDRGGYHHTSSVLTAPNTSLSTLYSYIQQRELRILLFHLDSSAGLFMQSSVPS